jgi:hypothetical protein
MLVEISVRVQNDQVVVDIPQLAVQEVFSNTLVYAPVEEVILDVGHGTDKIPSEVISGWEKQYKIVEYPAIYDKLNMEARFVYTILLLAIKKAQDAYEGFILKRLYRELSDRFVLHLQLPDYEKQLDTQRAEFEYMALYYSQISSLQINDRQIELPPKKIEKRNANRAIETYGLMTYIFIQVSVGMAITLWLSYQIAVFLPYNLLRIPLGLVSIFGALTCGFGVSTVMWVIIAKFIWSNQQIYEFVGAIAPSYMQSVSTKILLLFMKDIETG